MKKEEIESKICSETVFLEPRECYDDAIVDVKNNRIIYDYDTLIECHMIFYDNTYGDSVDVIAYDVVRAISYMGKYKPIINDLDDEDYDSETESDS
tara:strand:+ start:511 stop:798 length:288 start_codon:yes stop_codon:yes gene_type:complete